MYMVLELRFMLRYMYIHSRTMYVVPEWKELEKTIPTHTKYSKSPKFNDIKRGIRNKVMPCYQKMYLKTKQDKVTS